jgi:hypothetical protein
MRILSLPPFAWLSTLRKRFEEWGNVEIYSYQKLEIRRLDVLLLLMGVSIALFYWLLYSWQWAVIGTLMYVMVLMMALWMF